jgi:hypothetical protein
MFKKIIALMLFPVAVALADQEPETAEVDPLERVEQDQGDGDSGGLDISNRNLVAANRQDYTHTSSYRSGCAGTKANDGNKASAWIPETGGKEDFLEMSWGLAVPVTQVDILEKNSADISSLSLELFDGKKWEAVPHSGDSPRSLFEFSPRPASALRIKIKTTAGEGGIAEVVVADRQSKVTLPRYGSAALVAAMEDADAVVLFDGSPYAYSKAGRGLIQPRKPEACFADVWTEPVLESICTSLGGKAESNEPGRLEVTLNGRTFTLDTGAETTIADQIKSLSSQAGLEFLRQGPLVMVGRRLGPLGDAAVVSELNALLGRNPCFIAIELSKPGGLQQPQKSGFSALIENFIAKIKSWFAEPPPAADAVITPTMVQEGVTLEWPGFRATADPLTNADAWLKYSETTAVRPWVGVPLYMKPFVVPPKQVESAEEFEALKAQIRFAPEQNNVIATRDFLKKYHKRLSEEFGVYNALGIDVINQTAPKDWPDNIHDDFVTWASTYALTYYLAKNFGVAAHQYGNEPDAYFNQSTDQQIARRLTLTADAVHCAVEDANRDSGQNLEAVFSAPVLASDFTGRTARIMMQNLYTRYDGSRSPTPLFQLFNRHRYNGRPHQNVLEVQKAKKMMQEEVGTALPQVFTELNYSTGRNWSQPEVTFLNDTPRVFTSLASIWGMMMQEQGVFGIFLFNLNNSGVWFREVKPPLPKVVAGADPTTAPDAAGNAPAPADAPPAPAASIPPVRRVGPFSNTVTYSMYPEKDFGEKPERREQIAYGTKNFEVARLFGRGFHGSRPLLKTDISCSDPEYRAWTAFDEEGGRYYIWSVQVDEFSPYELEFDLGKLDLPPDALVTAEMVSGAHHGEMTLSTTLPQDRKIRMRQPAQSAMLLTVHKRPLKQESITPEADAMVVQGEQSKANFGAEKTLRVGRNASTGANAIGFLKFKLPEGGADIQRAVLELHGNSKSAHAYDGGFLFRVYAVEDGDWDEQAITAETAPGVNKTVSAMKKIDMKNYPLGHATCFNTSSKMLVDVTQAVREAQKNDRDKVDFILIREVHWPNENTDGFEAVLSSREADPSESPSLHLWK